MVVVHNCLELLEAQEGVGFERGPALSRKYFAPQKKVGNVEGQEVGVDAEAEQPCSFLCFAVSVPVHYL